jgi:membrane-associated phospholipid phosphatase
MKRRSVKPKADTKLERADIAVAEALVPVRKNAAVKAAGVASDVGDQPPLYGITGAVIVGGLATNDPRLIRAGARMLAAHVVAIELKNIFKLTIDRTRPDLIDKRGAYETGKGRRFEHDYTSFPSGHAASSVAVARALGREYPEQQNRALGAAATVAITQVIRSSHFVSDIVAGAALGFVADKVVDLLFRRFVPHPA